MIENDRADRLLVWLHEQKIFENKSTGCRLKDKKTDGPIECEKTRGQEEPAILISVTPALYVLQAATFRPRPHEDDCKRKR